MSSVFWRRIADYSQRSISITLAGLTVLGLMILAQEGQGVVHRYKQGKALKKTMASTASQDNQVSYEVISPLYENQITSIPSVQDFMLPFSSSYLQALDNSSETSTENKNS